MSALECERSLALDEQYVPILQLWILRLLLKCNGVESFVRERRFGDVAVAEFLGIEARGPDEYSPEWAMHELTAKMSALEAARPVFPEEAVVARNMRTLSRRLSLSPVEADILHFAVLQHIQAQLSEALSMVGELVRASLVRLLSVCLGYTESEVQRALSNTGRLSRSALLEVDDAKPYPFGHKVDLIQGFAEAMSMEHDDLFELFRFSFCRAREPELSLEDFPHLAADVRVLRPYLEQACRHEGHGVNILLHGVPGSGKTQFVGALAKAVGAQLMEVPCETPLGKPRAGHDRFESLRFAQTLLHGAGRHILLFDEVEDVFYATRGKGRFGGNASGIKGWVNRLLESNTVPVVWVTNCLEHIDPAYRRRFDYVLRMDHPPSSVRRRVLERELQSLPVSESFRERVACHPGVSVATLRRAVRVAVTAADVDTSIQYEPALSQVLSGSLQASDTAPLKLHERTLATGYRLDLLNSTADLGALAEGIVREGSGRVCLSGPPGTGKSEFARHVSRLMDRPCRVTRASDLLSPYVGMSEKNIARAFAEAAADGAVLVLDEADSFLRCRKRAQRSWEVTQVNEMLTALEAFDGVLFASTNLMDDLDEAVQRRFDVCVRLDFLKPVQVRELLNGLSKQLGIELTPRAMETVAHLPSLTPGDFAAALRGSKLCRPRSQDELVARLVDYSSFKAGTAPRPVGFIQ